MAFEFDQTDRAAAVDFLRRHQEALVERWSGLELLAGEGSREARADCEALVQALVDAVSDAAEHDLAAPAFGQVRPLIGELVVGGVRRGQSAVATVGELHRLKEPVLALWSADGAPVAVPLLLNTGLDTVRLLAMETALSSGADVIATQRQELVELSTPVVTLWDGVLAVPLIGTLDSVRSQVAMENLLQAILEQRAGVAILDITGVPTVDTLVAQHLLKTAMAARLMGAECVISGIRPQIAQTMVQLGIDLGEVATKATLADALRYALGRVGQAVTRVA
ncbi:STAS domain-containing protein [Actinokineospora soli]|uniref:STAS domain-containing protein n=1 Tax=Actinokineospora soli TaxID=1048753 RepID=A0ABW2TRA6_9PSEU